MFNLRAEVIETRTNKIDRFAARLKIAIGSWPSDWLTKESTFTRLH